MVDDAIAAIEICVADGRDTFLRERMILDAVIRNFEAVSRLSPTTRDPAEPVWRRITAFRNRLIHGYWSVPLPLVWDVIQKDLPGLKLEVARLRRDLGGLGPSTDHEN